MCVSVKREIVHFLFLRRIIVTARRCSAVVKNFPVRRFEFGEPQYQQNLANAVIAIIGRLAAPVPPLPNPPSVADNQVVTLGSDVRYSGTASESFVDWLQIVNRRATAET